MKTRKSGLPLRTFLTTLFVVCMLAGCGTAEPGNTDEIVTITPLTEEELNFFNGDDFFNGEYLNIKNQLLSSLYDSPEKIDLFELFYCGSGLPEEVTYEEKAAVIEFKAWDFTPDVDCNKVSRANMDTVLLQYTGLGLEDTDKVNLDNFTYLEEYDAYYYFAGDTNYRMEITFSHGEQEGDLIRLYYDDTFMADGLKVLTLSKQDKGYHFVSNQMAE